MGLGVRVAELLAPSDCDIERIYTQSDGGCNTAAGRSAASLEHSDNFWQVERVPNDDGVVDTRRRKEVVG